MEDGVLGTRQPTYEQLKEKLKQKDTEIKRLKEMRGGK